MSAHTLLLFDGFEIQDYGNQVPYLPLLLFEENDLSVCGDRTQDEGLEFSCGFITTAAEARRQLDLKGLDVSFCRAAFGDLLPDLIRTVIGWKRRQAKESDPAQITRIKEMQGDKDHNPSMYYGWGDHDLDESALCFDWYLDVLRRLHREKGACGFPYILPPAPSSPLARDPEALLVAAIHRGDVDTESGWIEDDLWFAMNARAWLEILPDSAEIELDFSDLVNQGYIEVDDTADIHRDSLMLMQKQIEADYRLYGYILKNDPRIDQQLRRRISSFSEEQLIAHVLLPLLRALGYEHVRPTDFHGPGEFGRDILPFRYVTPLGTVEYYAVQAKAVEIHGRSSREGNAGELVSQTTQAFHVSFVDPVDNERKRLDKFVIATNKGITQGARQCIEEALQANRRVVFLDLEQIMTLVKEHGLDHYVLFGVDH